MYVCIYIYIYIYLRSMRAPTVVSLDVRFLFFFYLEIWSAALDLFKDSCLMMLFISRSLKRLNKVTKSMYVFIMDLTTMRSIINTYIDLVTLLSLFSNLDIYIYIFIHIYIHIYICMFYSLYTRVQCYKNSPTNDW